MFSAVTSAQSVDIIFDITKQAVLAEKRLNFFSKRKEQMRELLTIKLD